MKNRIQIRFEDCHTAEEIHSMTEERLDIPAWTGERELLYHLLRRYAEEDEVLIELSGLYALCGATHTEAQLVWFALNGLQKQCPHILVDMTDAPWREELLRDPSYFEFGEIANPLVVDLSGCRYVMELHQKLQEAFALPEYYGKNWDALWDCLRDRFPKDEEWVVELVGTERMRGDAKASLPELLDVFSDVERECGNVRFVYPG